MDGSEQNNSGEVNNSTPSAQPADNKPSVAGATNGDQIANIIAAEEQKENAAPVSPEAPVSANAENGQVNENANAAEQTANANDELDYRSIAYGYSQLAAERERELEALRAEVQQFRARPVPPQVPAAPQPAQFDLAKFQEIAKTDPLKAIQMAAEQGLNPKLNDLNNQLQTYQQRIEQFEAQKQEEAFQNRVTLYQRTLEQADPEFKQGTPLYNAVYQYVVNNSERLRAWAFSDPNFNPVELAYNQVKVKFETQKNRALQQKLVDKRAKSVSVTPGSATPVVPTGDNAAEVAAAKLAQKGEPVPQMWVDSMKRSIKKHA